MNMAGSRMMTLQARVEEGQSVHEVPIFRIHCSLQFPLY